MPKETKSLELSKGTKQIELSFGGYWKPGDFPHRFVSNVIRSFPSTDNFGNDNITYVIEIGEKEINLPSHTSLIRLLEKAERILKNRFYETSFEFLYCGKIHLDRNNKDVHNWRLGIVS